MARIMGIDYGLRRVGIAVTDPLQLIATPLKTVESHKALDFLLAYVARESVGTIVVGLPLQLDGRCGNMVLHVKRFVRLLTRYFPQLVIETCDERFTSSLARKGLLEAGFKKKKRRDKGILDQMSATLILQSFLTLQS